MITVKLMGGLGNQMFQYACGRALAERMRTQLCFDLSAYKNYRLRGYGLDRFNTQVVNASWHLRTFTRLCTAARRVGVNPTKYFSALGIRWIIEAGDLRYQPQRLVFQGDAYLDGYWQCAHYFEDWAIRIREDFCLSTPLLAPFLKCKKQLGIGEGVTVSVHIRRGDYVTDKSTNKTHGVLGIDYYKNTFDYLIAQLGSDFRLVVFSDDTIWAKKNLSAPVAMTHVEANQRFPQIDVHLMAACDHHVIANSSFSWWGAWLNPSSSKIVIAPAQWYKSEALSNVDICPSEWVQL